MSKGIAGAVELAAGIGVQFIPGVGTAVGAALFHLGIANAGVANAIWDASKMAMMAGISTEAGAIAQALGSKSGLATTTRSPASLRQI
ncbi:MAG TPA: hypothetical protein VGS10_11510, partial [Terracidiphilus sp.]|nr:hypothetical protein [Terracidiphilus sp.]